MGESQLIDVAPGFGKTHTTTKLVNDLWNGYGIASIVFTLSYEMMDVVKGRKSWNKWQGKNRICTRNDEFTLLIDKGYSAPGCEGCDCGYSEQFDVPGPTIAVLNMLRGNPVDLLNLQKHRMWNLTYNESLTEPTDIKLFHNQVEKFRLLVVDEFDSSRMVGEHKISTANLRQLIRWTKNENTQGLLDALVRVVRATSDPNKPTELDYSLLGAELEKSGHSPEELLPKKIEDLRYQRTPKPNEVASAPPNVLPILLPIISWEAQALRHKYPFNARIHIEEGKLVVRYREAYAEVAPMLLLDASAEPEVICRAFHIDKSVEFPPSPELPDLPESVEVYQHSETDYGKRTVELFPENKGLDARKQHYDSILDDLSAFSHEAEIGVVTFKLVEQELAQYIRDSGYTNVATMHYRNVRSINTLEHVDVLVMYGSTRPSRDHIEVGAKALFFDEKALDFTQRSVKESLQTIHGYSVMTKSTRYVKDERLAAYQRQVGDWEMYQAFHRARPHLRTADDPLKVFVYSTIPIPGVNLTGFLGRYGEIAGKLREVLTTAESIRPSKLAHFTLRDGAKLNTEQRFIDRKKHRIAELAGAIYDRESKTFRFRTSG